MLDNDQNLTLRAKWKVGIKPSSPVPMIFQMSPEGKLHDVYLWAGVRQIEGEAYLILNVNKHEVLKMKTKGKVGFP